MMMMPLLAPSSDEQPEQTRGRAFKPWNKTPSDLADRLKLDESIGAQMKAPRCALALTGFPRFQPLSISFKDQGVQHHSSGVWLCCWRGGWGWPQSASQEPARARAVIDDEALPRFYRRCSVACRDNQNE